MNKVILKHVNAVIMILFILLGCCLEIMGIPAANMVWAASTVAQPAFSLEPGSYLTAQTVTVTCATAGATIRYTKDGTTPTTTSPAIVSGGTISVTKTMTLKARAWKTGYTTSPVMSGYYEIHIVATPTLSVASGTYTSVQKVIVSCSTPDATIYYTTNGADPSDSDPTVAPGSAVTVDQTMTLKVRAFKTDWTPSSLKSASYTIKMVDTPIFTPDEGSYLAAQQVTVSCPTSGATIRYTKDGTTPTTASPTIASGGTINVTKTTVLKARAWKTGYGTSPVKSASYEIRIVAIPTLSVASGTYTAVQKVVVGCVTPEVTIHYTTNGVDPTEDDPTIETGSTITVDKTMTIKVKAFKTDWTPSSVKAATYAIKIVDAPVFTPDEGSYLEVQRVIVTCPTTGATIRYTKDGTTPTTTSPTIASGGAITVSKNMTLKARAWKTGYGTSPVKSANYDIRIVAMPTLSVASGTYTAVQKVAASCATPDAVIRYTTNGVDPTELDPVFEQGLPVTIDKTVTLKVKAFRDNWTPSGVKSAAYTIHIVEPPVFSPDADSYLTAQRVIVTCPTTGATIRYTINGTIPTTTSPTIASGGAITVSKNMTLKARAWKTGYGTSPVKSADYEIRIVATPTLSVASGTYMAVQNVSAACATPGAVFHYTTNGVDPTESDPKVEAGQTIKVDQNMTLKVKAFKDNWTPSGVKSAVYTINVVRTPVLSPEGGSYLSVQQVTVTCATPGTIIHYTTDGTTPIPTSPTVPSGGTVTVSKTMILSAKAWKTGFTLSEPVSANYEIKIVATPTLSLSGGIFTEIQNVVVNCTTPGAVIHYTKNGVDPMESDPVVESGSTLTINKSATLKVRAFKQDWTPSDVKSEFYAINIVEAPVFSLESGVYMQTQQVKVTCPTEGATIHYTTDGSDPALWSQSIASGESIDVNKNMTLKARAYKNGYKDSPTTTANYEIRVVETPTLSQAGGTYTELKYVVVYDDMPEAVMHYTLNGADPTESDPVIAAGGLLTIDKTTTVKVRAFREGWTPSEVKSATYTINIVDKPVFSLEAGTYSTSQTVRVTCVTPGATIHYTTDGTTPMPQSPTIESGGEITVSRTMYLNAMAWKDGYGTSPMNSAYYEITIVVTPTASVESGTYTTVQHVQLTCPTPMALIHYTTDGQTPTEKAPYIYSGESITVDHSMTLRAKAFRQDWTPSETLTAWYLITITDQPVFSPASGSYAQPQQVTITCPMSDATIYYTTDGTQPTTKSLSMASGGTVTIAKSSTLKAMALREGYGPSSTVSVDYEIRIVESPSFTPPGGSYLSVQNVIISCGTPEAVIHYTTNGVEPTLNDPVVASGAAVTVDRTMTLMAKSFRDGWTPSDVGTAYYTINMAVIPVISPGEGIYTTPQTVTISCTTTGATIRYTTDGNEPTVSSTVYTKAISVNQSMTIKAKAWAAGYGPSQTVSAAFEIRVVQQPAFDVSAGTYSDFRNVTVTCPTPNAVIHYTLNGNDPTESDPLVVSGSVRVAYTSTLKAKAFLAGWGSSTVTSAAYTITKVMTPTLDPPGGDLRIGYVTVHCETPGATIRYTTNGSNPTTNSTVIADGSKIAVNQIMTIKAQAWKTNIAMSGVASGTYSPVVGFEDPNLDQVVREAIHKPSGTLYPTDFNNLYTLDATDREIASLEGIQRLTQLKELYLSENQITDLTPLADLTNLTTLSLSDNPIVNIQPLKSLTKMEKLVLNENYVRDIQVLRSLTNLTHLELDDNLVLGPDFTPLASLTKLEFLSLKENNLDDPDLEPVLSLSSLKHLILSSNYIHDGATFKPLTNLEELNLDSNEVLDPGGLSNNKALKKLSLSYNFIRNIGGLTGLTNLQYLDLSSNKITDITPLASLVNLTALDISGNKIKDLGVLSNFTNLESLYIGYNPVADISVLSGLSHLTTLDMYSDNGVKDFSALNQLTGLKTLNLSSCSLTAAPFLTYLNNLENLNLNYNQLKTVPDLTGKTQLKGLGLASNGIVDIGPIAQLTNLTQLDLSSNQLSNFTPLSNLVNLEDLELSSCKITNLSFLSPLINLDELKLSYNSLTNIQVLSVLTNLETLDLYNNQISDITPLTGLVKLRQLELDGNLITNVDALSPLYQLHYLSLRSNKLIDIQGVKDLKDLRHLDIGDNKPADSNLKLDLSPIVNLRCLESLFISGLQAQDYEALRGMIYLDQIFAPDANIGDLGVLSNLTNLTSLSFRNNPFTDISPLSGLNRLVSLEIPNIAVQDFSTLISLTTLRHLSADQTGMDSLNAIVNLTHLHTLLLRNNNITNADGLSSLIHLRYLYLDNNRIAGIPSLQDFNRLMDLEMNNNQIADLTPLEGLVNLTDLQLNNNKISDLTPLHGLVFLEDLQLGNNRITDLTPLGGLNYLYDLGLEANIFSDISILESLPNLDWLDIDENPNLITVENSAAYKVIQTLEARGCAVFYDYNYSGK